MKQKNYLFGYNDQQYVWRWDSVAFNSFISKFNQKVGSGVQLGVTIGQSSQTHIKRGKGMAKSIQSPDVNPVENLWTVLKKQVHARELTN